jgi:hypothetical protein
LALYPPDRTDTLRQIKNAGIFSALECEARLQRLLGCEEGDEVEGEGNAELLDDGTLEIELGSAEW